MSKAELPRHKAQFFTSLKFKHNLSWQHQSIATNYVGD